MAFSAKLQSGSSGALVPSGDPLLFIRQSAAMAVRQLPVMGRTLHATHENDRRYPLPLPPCPRGWRRYAHGVHMGFAVLAWTGEGC